MSIRFCLSLLAFLAAIMSASAQIDTVVNIPGTSYVNNVQFSQDGSYFLARDRDTVRVWSMPSGKQLGSTILLSGTEGYAAFLPGDTTVLTVAYSSDSLFKVWDWRTGKLLRQVNLYRAVHEALLVNSGRDIVINVYFPKDQFELWDVVAGTYKGVALDGENATGLALDSAGKTGVILRDNILYHVDVSQHSLDTFHVNSFDFFRGYLSYDGSRLGYSRVKGPPLIMDALTLDSLFSLDVDMSEYTRVTMDISRDNQLIATITTRRTGTPSLDLWDGTNGRHLAQLGTDDRFPFGTLKISPRKDYVVIYNSKVGMLLWPLSLPSSVPTEQIVPGLMAYPNPSSSNITVEWYQPDKESGSIQLIGLQGQTVWRKDLAASESGDHREPLPVNELSSGIYLCIVEAGSHHYVTSVVIER
jgi:WD40 repeat protein